MTGNRDGGRRPEEIHSDIVKMICGPYPTTAEQWIDRDTRFARLWNELHDVLGPEAPGWARLAVGLVADHARREAEYTRVGMRLGR